MPRYLMPVAGLLACLALSITLSPCTALGGQLTAIPEGVQAELSLADLDDRQHTVEEFRGQVVLVNFWAGWCMPCIQEMPSILRLQEAMRGRPFAVIGVNVAEGKRRVQTLVRQLDLDFLILLDRDGSEFRRWGAEVLPTTYILDSDGRPRYVALGPLDWDAPDIVATLQELLPRPPAPHQADHIGDRAPTAVARH